MSNNAPVSDAAFETLFTKARTYNAWQKKDVPESLLRQLHDIVKFGPTSANCCPLRIVFVKSHEAKARLEPLMDEGNRKKTMEAPVTAIFGYDLEFYEYMAKLFPHNPSSREWFANDKAFAKEAAFRNATLQAGYFMIGARGLGLDCGPMSGFDADGVKKEFFSETTIVPDFLCNLGYGDSESLFPRSPRFTFDEICSVL